jgi:hypothetical protein
MCSSGSTVQKYMQKGGTGCQSGRLHSLATGEITKIVPIFKIITDLAPISKTITNMVPKVSKRQHTVCLPADSTKCTGLGTFHHQRRRQRQQPTTATTTNNNNHMIMVGSSSRCDNHQPTPPPTTTTTSSWSVPPHDAPLMDLFGVYQRTNIVATINSQLQVNQYSPFKPYETGLGKCHHASSRR